MTMKPAAALLLTLLALPAAAQAVYRCGNEYSQKPCAEARTVDVQDTRTAGEAQAATAQAQRNAKLAGQMEKERLAEERRVAGPSMIVTGVKPVASQPAPTASHAKKDKGKGRKAPEHFTAVAPAKK